MSIARRLNLCKRASRSCSWISGIDGGSLGRGNWGKWTAGKSILPVDARVESSSRLNFQSLHRENSKSGKFRREKMSKVRFIRYFLSPKFPIFALSAIPDCKFLANLPTPRCRITPTDRSLLSLLYISNTVGKCQNLTTRRLSVICRFENACLLEATIIRARSIQNEKLCLENRVNRLISTKHSHREISNKAVQRGKARISIELLDQAFDQKPSAFSIPDRTAIDNYSLPVNPQKSIEGRGRNLLIWIELIFGKHEIWKKVRLYAHERVPFYLRSQVAVMKMAGRPTLVEYKAAGGLGSESRGQSEPVGRAQRQP